MKRFLSFFLSLTVFLSGFFILIGTAYAVEQYNPATFTVDRIEGKAYAVNREGHLTTLAAGTEVVSGSVITTDKGSYVWITIDGYKHIKMDQSTEILVTHYKGDTDVTVNYGKTLVSTDTKVPDGDHLHVRAGGMDTEVKGSAVLTEVSVFAKVEVVFKKGSAGSSVTTMKDGAAANVTNKSGGKIELIGKIGYKIMADGEKGKVQDAVTSVAVTDNSIPTVTGNTVTSNTYTARSATGKSTSGTMENGEKVTVTEEKKSDTGSSETKEISVTPLEGTVTSQYNADASGADSVTISHEKIAAANLPMFVLTEIAEDNANGGTKGLAAKIKKDTVGRIDLTSLTPQNINEYSKSASEGSNNAQESNTLYKDKQMEEWVKLLQPLIEEQQREEAQKKEELERIETEHSEAKKLNYADSDQQDENRSDESHNSTNNSDVGAGSGFSGDVVGPPSGPNTEDNVPHDSGYIG